MTQPALPIVRGGGVVVLRGIGEALPLFSRAFLAALRADHRVFVRVLRQSLRRFSVQGVVSAEPGKKTGWQESNQDHETGMQNKARKMREKLI